MEKQKTIHEILRLPQLTGRQKDRSAYALLKDIGYFGMADEISENDLMSALEKSPEHIAGWLVWSENKRTREGWYFKKDDLEKYIVGHLSTDAHSSNLKAYDDDKEACANFIKLEIEDIRNS